MTIPPAPVIWKHATLVGYRPELYELVLFIHFNFGDIFIFLRYLVPPYTRLHYRIHCRDKAIKVCYGRGHVSEVGSLFLPSAEIERIFSNIEVVFVLFILF